jgi:hypothetical protein
MIGSSQQNDHLWNRTHIVIHSPVGEYFDKSCSHEVQYRELKSEARKSGVTNKAATFVLVSAVVISSNPNPRHVLLDGRGRN